MGYPITSIARVFGYTREAMRRVVLNQVAKDPSYTPPPLSEIKARRKAFRAKLNYSKAVGETPPKLAV